MTQLRFVVAILMLCPGKAPAQEVSPSRLSPLALVSARYKDAYIKITYSQPSKRGREIFGSLVPYGQIWRTGANEATELTTTKDIQVNGTLLKAGTYSLFTIPNKDKWTIIFNSEPGLQGSYNYNDKLDALRFDAMVQSAESVYESFTIVIDQQNDHGEIALLWDRVKVAFPFQFIELKP